MIAILVTFFTSKIGQWVAIVGAALIAIVSFATWEHHRGYQQCKVEWANAEQEALDRGAKARSDAEQSVGTGGVRDPYDSDNN